MSSSRSHRTRQEKLRTSNSRPPGSVGVGVGVLVYRGDKVLLIKRTGSHGEGTWAPPGGHVEFGESFEETAVREVAEEVGITITDVVFKFVTNDVFETENKHYVTIWMTGEYSGGELHIASHRELTAVDWFSWDDLPSPLFLPLENLRQGKQYHTATEVRS